MPKRTLHQLKKHPHITHKAIEIAFVVGTVLALINHYDVFIKGTISGTEILQIIITYVVPFSVAVYSAGHHAEMSTTEGNLSTSGVR